MGRLPRWLLIGIPSLAAVVLHIDASTIKIEDGSIPVKVTVHSEKPCRLQKVTYAHYGRKEEVDADLRLPNEHTRWAYRDARIQNDVSFFFDVPNSNHVSLFGILRNTFYWRRFAVFRIECGEGEPVVISAVVPDPRKTKSLTITIP